MPLNCISQFNNCMKSCIDFLLTDTLVLNVLTALRLKSDSMTLHLLVPKVTMTFLLQVLSILTDH